MKLQFPFKNDCSNQPSPQPGSLRYNNLLHIPQSEFSSFYYSTRPTRPARRAEIDASMHFEPSSVAGAEGECNVGSNVPDTMAPQKTVTRCRRSEGWYQ